MKIDDFWDDQTEKSVRVTRENRSTAPRSKTEGLFHVAAIKFPSPITYLPRWHGEALRCDEMKERARFAY